MRMLIILPSYPPKQNPRSFRWKVLAEYWAKKGWEIHYVTASHERFQRYEMVNGVHVYRVGHANMMDWYYDVFKIKNRRDVSSNQRLTTPKIHIFSKIVKAFAANLIWILHECWKLFYFPDGSCIWIYPAKRKATSLLKAQEFDLLVSVSLPFSSHLVGLACKKKYPGMRWLVDIGDPFSFVHEYFLNNRILYKKLNFIYERKIFQFADAISVTVEATRQRYIELFLVSAGKLHVIPPLFEPSAFKFLPQTSVNKHQSPKIHLGYFGTFHDEIRSPKGLLWLVNKAFEVEPALKDAVVLHITGHLSKKQMLVFQTFANLNDNLVFHGLIPREQVATLIENMDFLLNVGNATSYHLPSKAAEYLMSGKPIINIATIEMDTVAEFLNNYPLLLNLVLKNGKPEDVQVLTFLDFLKMNKGKTVGWAVRQQLGEAYKLKNIAKQYERLF